MVSADSASSLPRVPDLSVATMLMDALREGLFGGFGQLCVAPAERAWSQLVDPAAHAVELGLRHGAQILGRDEGDARRQRTVGARERPLQVSERLAHSARAAVEDLLGHAGRQRHDERERRWKTRELIAGSPQHLDQPLAADAGTGLGQLVDSALGEALVALGL